MSIGLKFISPVQARRLIYLWLLSLLVSLLVTGCGDGSSETQQPTDVQVEQQNPFSIKLQAFIENTPFDELGPIVSAGLDQFADANVVIALNGSAEAQGDAKLTNIEWGQLDGPEVDIPNPNSLSNILAIPDSSSSDQVILYLQATDSNGRTNADFTVLSVIPLETFVRVISTSVDEDAGTVTVRVELNRVSDQPTRVNFKTLDGSAKAGFDYVPEEGETTIPAGEIGIDITIALLTDQIVEADETLLLYVAGENSGVQTTGIGSVIIRSGGNDPSLLFQSITFADLGPFEGMVGDTIENAVVEDPENSPGTGAVSYSSSNPLVATVDPETGIVTLLGEGTVVITAAKAEDATYAFAQASYTINVSLVEQQLAFEDSGPVTAVVNQVISNPLIEAGDGSGIVTFASSDAAVVSVDSSTGDATALAEGSATVTATKAADSTYAEASASFIINVELNAQTLAFESAGPLTGFVGSTIDNPLAETGDGSGAIGFSSSNELVASVDSDTGEVSLLAVGTAEITATKAADNVYAEATASYTIAVELNTQTLQFDSPGPLNSFVGDTINNPLVESGEGTGDIVFSSSNETVATVNSTTGEVNVLAVGSTSITASKAADEVYAAAQASYSITVERLTQQLEFTLPGPLTVQVGDVFTNALAETGNGSGSLVFSSSNPEVASVDATTGEVTVLTVGTTTITASKAADPVYEAAEASYTVEVDLLEQTIQFENSGQIGGFVGSTINNPLVETGAGTGAITYSSSTPSVATVDESTGIVTLVGEGNAIITATKAADNRYLAATASFIVSSELIPQTLEFTDPGPVSAQNGESFSNPVLPPEGTGNVTYSSSNTSVAVVDTSSGLVQIVNFGAAVITATVAADSQYAGASANYSIIVGGASQSISFSNPGPVTLELDASSFVNVAAGGDGTGAITYSSSNESVATVNSTTGAVNVIATGTTTIRADKAADSLYDSASASYQLNVTLISETLRFQNDGPVTIFVNYGDTYTNPLIETGDGPGAISYSCAGCESEDAYVDEVTGEVEVFNPTTITVTANKQPGGNYAGGTVSYQLIINFVGM